MSGPGTAANQHAVARLGGALARLGGSWQKCPLTRGPESRRGNGRFQIARKLPHGSTLPRNRVSGTLPCQHAQRANPALSSFFEAIFRKRANLGESARLLFEKRNS